ncbi:ABC transporter permease [Streptomyces sp. CFMR 7]|uniref:ABC transporter permease n=1 Tax=Streptomyces sp. CFMR 7 TaxID=1649184 RepID=UPI0011A1010D|nr:ABC transporter permease [Streptomyces sp. CFMR 7]
MAGANCLATNDWICGEYLRSRSQELTDATVQHIGITVVSVLIGLAVAFPLALLARRGRGFAGPVLGLTTVLYTVPSLAMFSLLLPLFGLSAALVVTGLVLYSLTILVRNILAGLEAVPQEAKEAARGMGYGPWRLLWEVELPLALPALMAGLRIATVSTVALTTVGSLVGKGGLGNLIEDALPSFFKAQVLTASVLCVLLAVTADLLLLGLQRLLTPWTRISAATGETRTGGAGGPKGSPGAPGDAPSGSGGSAGIPAPAKVEAG